MHAGHGGGAHYLRSRTDNIVRIHASVSPCMSLCVCMHLCMCLYASVHVVQDQRQFFYTGTAQKQIQDIVKGGGGGRTPGSVRTTYAGESGGILQEKLRFQTLSKRFCGHFSIQYLLCTGAVLGVVRWVRTNHPSSSRNINLQTYIYSSVILSFKRCSGELASFIVASY